MHAIVIDIVKFYILLVSIIFDRRTKLEDATLVNKVNTAPISIEYLFNMRNPVGWIAKIPKVVHEIELGVLLTLFK